MIIKGGATKSVPAQAPITKALAPCGCTTAPPANGIATSKSLAKRGFTKNGMKAPPLFSDKKQWRRNYGKNLITVFVVNLTDIAVPVAVVAIEQFVGRCLAGLDGFFDGIEEVGFIRNQATRTSTRTRFQASL